MKKSICVFCGSKAGSNPVYLEAAKELGEKLCHNGQELIYGAASIGIMGMIADTVLENGGVVKGVIPQSIFDMEVGHSGLTKIEVVDSMHSRKQLMYDWSDAFVAMPGGIGTLDEYCEIVTWAQLQHHTKPCYVLNINGFYDHLIAHFKHINKEGFLSDEHLGLIKIVDTVDELVADLTL